MNAPADVDTKIGRQAQRVLARLKKNRTAAGLLSIAGLVLGTLRDLAPIVVVVAVFQVAILRQPFPDLGGMIGGLVLVMLGLALFIKGLEMGLFPLGEGLAQGFAHKGSLIWLLVFAFALGFGTTVAEPALIAVTAEAARVAADAGVVAADPDAMDAYALGLRYTVALSVGVGITLGVLRIIKGWPLHYWIIGGYVVAVGLTFLAPDEIVGIAYDSGRGYDVHHHRADGDGAWRRSRHGDPRAQPADRRLRPHRLREPHAHHLRARLRHGVLKGGALELISLILSAGMDTVLDVAPLIGLVLFFQIVVLRQRPANLGRITVGFVYVVIGLVLFLIGLEEALFPLGKTMAAQLTDPAFLGLAEGATAHWLDYGWVYAFAAAIGFGTTIAEPSLMAVARKAAAVSGGTIRPWGLRIAVAIGVAVGVGLGAVRIVTGLPLHYLFMSAYAIVIVLTIFASRSIIALAYDSGGVTSSTVTVPLVAALGLGLAANVPGRSPMLDGFGLIAFACVFAVIAVLGYAQLSSALQAARKRRSSGKGA